MRTLTSDCVSFLTSTLPYAPSISISRSQRKLKMGYHRVTRCLDVLAKAGYLSSEAGQRKTALKFWQSSPIPLECSAHPTVEQLLESFVQLHELSYLSTIH